jgi:hemolysin activation/secretion protein
MLLLVAKVVRELDLMCRYTLLVFIYILQAIDCLYKKQSVLALKYNERLFLFMELYTKPLTHNILLVLLRRLLVSKNKICISVNDFGVRMFSVKHRFLGCLLWSFCANLLAQSPSKAIEQIQQQQEELLKQEQLRREQELQALDELTPPGESEQDSTQAIEEEPKDAACITFDHIKVTGATLLKESQISALLEPYQGQCLSVAKMTQLQADLTNHYIGAGFITTRVYFPKQSFTDGDLKLWVLEGKYESIDILERPKADAPKLEASKAISPKTENPKIENPEVESPEVESHKTETTKEDSKPVQASQPRTGFNTVLHRPDHEVLNLRDLEQAVDQINRLSRYDAKMMLEPGDAEGTSKVKLYTVKSKPWSLSTNLANNGSKTLGEYQSTYGTRFEDILGLYELWSFSYARELNANRWDRYGRSYSGYLSIPYQYWTFNYSSSLYEYKTPVKGKTLTYSTSGNSRTHQLEVKRVIHRDQLGKTQLAGKLKRTESRSYIEEAFVGVSSRKASAWSLGLEHSRRWRGGVLSGSLTFERGLPWWDAKKRINHDETTPEPLYSRWSSSISFYKPFALWQQNFAWSTSLQGLYSDNTLYNSERLSIGGQYAVRGFESSDLQGDQGIIWRNELQYSLPYMPLFTANHKVFAAYDLGGVVKDWREANERGTLQGMAVGYNLSNTYVSSRLLWEQGLQAPARIKKQSSIFRFLLTLNY